MVWVAGWQFFAFVSHWVCTGAILRNPAKLVDWTQLEVDEYMSTRCRAHSFPARDSFLENQVAPV